MGLRELPSVDALADTFADGDIPRQLVIEASRAAIAAARASVASGGAADPARLVTADLDRLRGLRSRRVINATGVLLHTNLGRAVWPGEAADEAHRAAVGYDTVEFDLSTGRRGGRGEYASELLRAVTGAEAALVVNNNAAGLVLSTAALASSSGVAVSRGELIEIGGSFRLPELMAASGCTLVEVGTTNRTRIADYAAVLDRVAMVLKVHTSNYRIAGFAEEVGYGALAQLAAGASIPFAADVGSGLLDARVPWLNGGAPPWLADEPGVIQTLDAGADLVLFSGDKLVGGPQAGLIVGRTELVDRLARHPLARATRCDGPTLAAVEAVLQMYASGRAGDIPFWRAASLSYASLEARAGALRGEAGIDATIVSGLSVPGAGSVPGKGIPSPLLRIEGNPDELWGKLLKSPDPIVARREEGGLIVDLRTVAPEDDGAVAAALDAACRS